MTDSQLSRGFFAVGIVLLLISMVLGPYGYTQWAVATALVACFLALTGTYLAFQSWKEPLEPAQKPKVPLSGGPAPEERNGEENTL